MNKKIDFVLTWVDGNDPEWQKGYQHYKSLRYGNIKEKNDTVRFRDWDNLRYWFRGVEKFAPWVNKIHFITQDQRPNWLNVNHPKLNLISHKDYIPANFLPTYNSNVIEPFIYNIKELSEKFVLFNDDLFIINHVKQTRFFKNNLPCDMGVMDCLTAGSNLNHTLLNNIDIIQQYFNKKNVLKENISKWFNPRYGIFNIVNLLLLPWKNFTGFYDPHLTQSFLKSTHEKIWSKKVFNDGNFSKFREKSDINQYLFRYWHLLEGKFTPLNLKKDSQYFLVNNDNIRHISQIIRKQSKNIIVLNDSDSLDFDFAKLEINNAFKSILPNKCSFENSDL